MMLAHLMANVYEDEDDVNHDDYLTLADFRHHRSQSKVVQQGLKRGELPRAVAAADEQPKKIPHAYRPSYAIRPSVSDVLTYSSEFVDCLLTRPKRSTCR